MKQLPDFETSIENQIVGLISSRIPKLDHGVYSLILKEANEPGLLISNPETAKGIPDLREALESKSVIDSALREIKAWSNAGIKLVALGDDAYPQRLGSIYEPPPLLFYRGSLSLINQKYAFISVVGARRADRQGREIAYQLSMKLAKRGVCVVSGLAYGIDAQAHIGAIESSVRSSTIAVLGNGLFKTYPAKHDRLAERIIEQDGLIVSQFEPDAIPYPNNFLNRNRVIAGLSDGVIVVQAAGRSGSLSTARHALEEGREVMAIPGEITNDRYKGTNRLIQQGAYLISSVEDVEEIFPSLKSSEVVSPDVEDKQECEDLTEAQIEILSILKQSSSFHYEELRYKISDQNDFDQELLELELRGFLMRLPGNLLSITPNI